MSIPAILVFGDSTLDTGNNNNIITLAKCNFPPYGRDFERGKPTGRFSNGKVISDFIVEDLGIKEFLPAYLDPNLPSSELPTGVCFASGGSGYDPLTSLSVSAIGITGQLDLFRDYIAKLNLLVGENTTNFILSNSIFVVGFGSNDIAKTYFMDRIRQLHYDIPSYTDLMLNSASDLLKELHELGARRIAVMSLAPLGCLPFQRTINGGIARNCAENVNDAAKLFNSKLKKELDFLNKNFPESRNVYIDLYNPFQDIIANYQKYGYKVEDRGCCGTGAIEVVFLCSLSFRVCPNDSEYVFWDSFHPAEIVYKRLIPPILAKYLPQFE